MSVDGCLRHAAHPLLMDKPFSAACERNRDAILGVLRSHFQGRRHVLEIGSGTGQHAVHIAAAMSGLTWQCSDRTENLPGIRSWLEDAGLANTLPPVELDVASDPWRSGFSVLGAWSRRFDAVFSANTLHIMGWPQVEAFFDGLPHVLADAATVIVYGPFNYNGAFTSDSNRSFDASLRAHDQRMGIRDFAAVDALARAIGLRPVDDIAMPANNRCLVWRCGSAAVRSQEQRWSQA